MAVRRTRSTGNGPLIGLVVFVFLFVIALSLAILFYQQRAGQQEEFAETRAELQELATTAERASPEVERVRQRAQQENRSVVQQLLTDVRVLKRTMAGDPSVSVSRIEEQVEGQLTAMGVAEGLSVLEALQRLQNEMAQMDSQIASLQSQVDARTQRLDELDQRFQDLQTASDQKIQSLSQQIAEMQSGVNTFGQQAATQRQQLQQRLAQVRQETQQQIQQRNEQISQLEEQLEQRESRLSELQQMVGGQQPQAPDQTEEPDGRIIDISNQENMVYVNLGRRDHVVPGMTFEVFDSARGVQVGEQGEQLRGKATIEIVDISETSSAARIVRSSFSRPVVPNDVIANLVYDQNREFKFYVFGRFDLNGDGQYTIGERQTIISMIQQWGGTVIDPEQRRAEFTNALGEEAAQQNLLPADTDFVVIGREPDPPQAAQQQQGRDPQEIRQGIEARQRWQRFQQILNEAEALSIPIVNQNRFLALIGHYDR